MLASILIIDDDEELFALLRNYLEVENFRCSSALDAETALKMLEQTHFDIVILDVMLPGMNGFDVLRHIRSQNNTRLLPVLMLTAKGDEVDRIVGLEMGADDYLGKPFNPRELVARLRALLRRIQKPADTRPETTRQIGSITINKNALCITCGAVKQDLSSSEMRLLEYLTENIGQVVTRDFLYKKLFGHLPHPSDRSLDMLVSRLRRKLGPRPDGSERIRSVRSEGYIYLCEE